MFKNQHQLDKYTIEIEHREYWFESQLEFGWLFQCFIVIGRGSAGLIPCICNN